MKNNRTKVTGRIVNVNCKYHHYYNDGMYVTIIKLKNVTRIRRRLLKKIGHIPLTEFFSCPKENSHSLKDFIKKKGFIVCKQCGSLWYKRFDLTNYSLKGKKIFNFKANIKNVDSFAGMYLDYDEQPNRPF